MLRLSRSPRWSIRAIGASVLWLTRSRREARLEPDVERKLASPLFEATLTVTVSGHTSRTTAAAHVEPIVGAFGLFGTLGRTAYRALPLRRGPVRRRVPFLLTSDEAALLWHPPTAVVRAPALPSVVSRELEPPLDLPRPGRDADVVVLGETTFRGIHRKVGLLPEDKARHLHLVGKTGVGKSTLLLRLLLSDIARGGGVALLDPHGDLCETVVARIPRRRTGDIVLFDPADADWPVAFNLLDQRPAAERPLLASNILVAFKKLYRDSWGPRLEHLLRHALLALLEVPGASLLHVPRLFADPRFRDRIARRLADPVVRDFWLVEFASMPPKLQAEAAAPVLNKVGAFLASPILRHILGQPRTRLRIRPLMDRGGILLCNLAKGRIGEDASTLLGSLLVTEIQLAAMSRADRPEADRRPFSVYLDEFQSFSTATLATVLSEARKYRVDFTLAHQFLEQLDPETAAAVFGNVGSLVAFQLGADAESLATHLGAPLAAEDLRFLPKHHAYARLLVRGVPTRPFSLRTLAPEPASSGPRLDVVRRHTRERYAQPVAVAAKAVADLAAA